MGQYYQPIIQVNGSQYAKIDMYGEGLKLLEHAWFGGPVCNAVCDLLRNSRCRIWWIGDYADNADLIKANFTFPEQADFEHSHVAMNKNNSKFPRYVVNVDKQEYIQLDHTEGEDDLFPVAILTAVGNGRGGGDYFGPHAEYAGAWAGDLLMGATSLVGVLNKYKNMTEEYTFVDY